MNDRIKQLAEQAGMYVEARGEPWPKWMSAEECELAYAKFAELIVQECADLALSHSIYSRGVPWNQVILQHWDLPITDSDVAAYLRTQQRE
jgi:hypothetical protein